MMGDYREKYLRLSADFQERAGRLSAIQAKQRRLVLDLSKGKHDESVKTLLVSVAESVEAGEALLSYTHKMLQGVGEDAKALCEGAELRNTIKSQSDLITEFLNQ